MIHFIHHQRYCTRSLVFVPRPIARASKGRRCFSLSNLNYHVSISLPSKSIRLFVLFSLASNTIEEASCYNPLVQHSHSTHKALFHLNPSIWNVSGLPLLLCLVLFINIWQRDGRHHRSLRSRSKFKVIGLAWWGEARPRHDSALLHSLVQLGRDVWKRSNAEAEPLSLTGRPVGRLFGGGLNAEDEALGLTDMEKPALAMSLGYLFLLFMQIECGFFLKPRLSVVSLVGPIAVHWKWTAALVGHLVNVSIIILNLACTRDY
ncbi:hypothetical protein LENED_007733 [Lentinula edodes]|uniref:Uncharacterized protein n=1 Tax=Lentinula edodes TaxID=5353 RepID=A0A1Q3EF57_LENED|nr:hypothetical protein LENED_007733 [Lentinula edodes]